MRSSVLPPNRQTIPPYRATVPPKFEKGDRVRISGAEPECGDWTVENVLGEGLILAVCDKHNTTGRWSQDAVSKIKKEAEVNVWFYTRRADVTSSFITVVAYNDKTRELLVGFKRGSAAIYQDVPRFEFADLLASESVGERYNSEVKEQYRGRVVPEYELRHEQERPASPPKFVVGQRVLTVNGRVGEILREVGRAVDGERRYFVAYEGGGGNNTRESNIVLFDGEVVYRALKEASL